MSVHAHVTGLGLPEPRVVKLEIGAARRARPARRDPPGGAQESAAGTPGPLQRCASQSSGLPHSDGLSVNTVAGLGDEDQVVRKLDRFEG